MVKITKEYKVPYVNKVIPAGTTCSIIGVFNKEPDIVKIKILTVPKKNRPENCVEFEDVYGVHENIFND